MEFHKVILTSNTQGKLVRWTSAGAGGHVICGVLVDQDSGNSIQSSGVHCSHTSYPKIYQRTYRDSLIVRSFTLCSYALSGQHILTLM